jgi:amino acid permease
MFGALRVPFNNVIFVKDLYPELNFVWSIVSISVVGVLFLLGVVIIIQIGKFDRDSIEV